MRLRHPLNLSLVLKSDLSLRYLFDPATGAVPSRSAPRWMPWKPGHPDLIATANIGCYAYLRQEARVPVVHWVELLG